MSGTARTYPRPTNAAVVVALAGVLALAAGGAIVFNPLLGLFAGTTILTLLALALVRHFPVVFVASLWFTLLGYAFGSRGFAYLGVPPIYIGEMVLGLAALYVLTSTRVRWTRLHWLLIAFMCWGLVRTVPYLQRDGMDAARDAVLWIYALFAIAAGQMFTSEVHFRKLAGWYRRLVPIFCLWIPVAAWLHFSGGRWLPRAPGSSIPIVVFKAGDVGVHLAAAAAFVLAGLYAANPRAFKLPTFALWTVWLAALGVAGAISRGGLLAALAGASFAFILRPSRHLVAIATAGVMLLTIIGLINPQLDVGSHRNLSLQQLASNVISVASNTGQPSLDGTKEWRLRWWNDIFDYTVRGPYFWTGKGFGVNLADEDGYQVAADSSVRSPHNSHMTVLARLGVPGLLLWVTLQLLFAVRLLRASRRAHRSGKTFWMQVDVWLLAYWLAMMLNASFDVYLEGPQGGIWFWTIFGLGIAALRLQAREAPTVLDPEQTPVLEGPAR